MEMNKLSISKGQVISLYQKYLKEHHKTDRWGQVCCICNKHIKDKCLECKGCHCVMHDACYNLRRHPEKTWYCIVCEDILRYCLHIFDYDKFEEADIEKTEPAIMKSRNRVFCCICGYSKGAMVRTVLCGIYCHLSCASWCEEVQLSNTKGEVDQSLFQKYYSNPQHLIPICNPFHLNTKRMEGICSVCNRRGGVVRCSSPDCTRCCHVLCGYSNGWRFDSSSLPRWNEHEGCPPYLSTNREILCKEHTPLALIRSSKPLDIFEKHEQLGSPDLGAKSDHTNFEKPFVLPVCQTTTLVEPSDPSSSFHHCDVFQAKWSDLTCLSWPSSPFKLPRFLESVPLMNSIITKGDEDQKGGTRKETFRGSTSLPNFDDALEPGVWRIERRKINMNAFLNPKENAPSKKSVSSGGVKRFDDSLNTPSKKMKVEKKQQPTQNSSPPVNSEKVKSSACNVRVIQEQKICLQQQSRFCPQVQTPDLSLVFNCQFGSQEIQLKLTELISSPKFVSLFGKYPYKNMLSSDQIYHKYVHFYHRGVNRQVFERYKNGNLCLDDILMAPNQDMVSLEQILLTLNDDCKAPNTILFVLRCLLVSTFYSIYPPHLCTKQMAQERSTFSRSLVLETNHLSSLCSILFELALEFNNLLCFYTDSKMYKERRTSADSCLQCICLCDSCDESLHLVCDSCHVGYHPKCIGLQQTGYSEIQQTKFCGYWDLRKGFLCPRCCAGEIYEMSPFEKGVVQIKEKFLKSRKMSNSKKQERSKH